jgi:formiminotetrahydrofolate cyclodeaminase
MVEGIFSKKSAKITTDSSKKDQQEEIRRDEHIRHILKAANKLPMKIVRTEKDINEFFED